VGRYLPALRERRFARLWLALLGQGLGVQALEVAIGWQVYSISHNPLELGWIGLAEFLPMFLLALPAGQLADRLPRPLVFAAALALGAAVAGGLVGLSLAHTRSVPAFLALAFAAGVSNAVGTPAAKALPPMLVGPDLLANAMALRSIAGQGSQALGPALGGLLYPLSPAVVYSVSGALMLVAALIVAGVRTDAPVPADAAEPSDPGRGVGAPPRRAPGLASVLEGIRFLRRAPIVLGAIMLDLFAVLFGGAVSLAPVFAVKVLHIGPTGLGFLRAAPAVGAVLGALYLTWRPLGGRTGRTLLIAVASFGAAIVVFGLSRSLPLSFAALAVSGFADMFSVNIRSTTVALATPDELRGRVLAVEMVFISASNQLGAFESGVAAFLLGAVPAVVSGGVVTIVLALLWMKLFPDLARVDRLERVRPVTS
jgi:MFS family permease